MPVFRGGPGRAPAWCEMTHFDVIVLQPDEERYWRIENPREKWIIVQGSCAIRVGERPAMTGAAGTAKAGDQTDVAASDGGISLTGGEQGTAAVRMCGRWGDELGGSGIFHVANAERPSDHGDAAHYPKKTNFDRHYHDCDEYWIILEGSGAAVSENRRYEVRAGDCVATGRGHHHDFVEVFGDTPVKAVFFETTLEGRKRLGHLWNHTHGPAEPVAERV